MRTEVARERVEGALLGCALGDALGLPMEGLTSRQIAADFEPLDRFRLVGRRGFVSDDTEQTALVAQSLLEGHDAAGVVRRFRHHLKWWVARLPFGIGLATLRAGLRLWFGFRRSGVPSGGNGAAMRAAIIGVVVSDPGLRWAVVDGVSQVSHTHPLAVEGARYLAEAAALLAADDERVDTVLRKALRAVQNPALATAIGAAPPRWSWAGAMARNLALYPVILAHGFCRLLPRRRR